MGSNILIAISSRNLNKKKVYSKNCICLTFNFKEDMSLLLFEKLAFLFFNIGIAPKCHKEITQHDQGTSDLYLF